MIKKQLKIHYNDEEFKIIGISSSEKSYKVAWYLNSFLGIRLIKQKDIEIYYENNSYICVSNHVHKYLNCEITLLKNKLEFSNNNKYQSLLPEYHAFDFILKIKNFLEYDDIALLLKKIKEIKIIEYCDILTIDHIKSKNNLIY